jgi:hypothetical protein
LSRLRDPPHIAIARCNLPVACVTRKHRSRLPDAARVKIYLEPETYGVGAGDENRTRVLSLGSGEGSKVVAYLVPDQDAYRGAVLVDVMSAGTPRALPKVASP